MTQPDKTVKKISLTLLAGDSPENFNYSAKPVPFEFIFGIETAGLTPFELSLDKIQPGETTKLTLAGNELEPFFGNLLVPLCRAIGLRLLPANLCLEVDLIECSDATPREIVQAMAKSVGHGGGCGGDDCGCGCH